MKSPLLESVTEFFRNLGGLIEFSFRYLINVLLPPYDLQEIARHMDELGVKTLPIVSIMGIIVGLVLSLQSQPVLARFGAEAFLPNMVSLSVVRELGPVLTALIFAGRVSSGIGAELGSMRVTEQIDAMEVSAINPFKFLVVTRVTACTLILPVLTLYVMFLAMIGTFIAVLLIQNTTLTYFIDSFMASVKFTDFGPGLAKTFYFGFIVGIVGAYKGYTADKGTEGVGKASTTAVVMSSLLILITDMVLVKITVWLWPG